MTKKLLAIMLCVMIVTGLVGCSLLPFGSEEATSDEGTKAPEESNDMTNDENTKPEDTTSKAPESTSKEPTQTTPDVDPTTTPLNANTAGIKILGERAYVSEDEQQINCDWTCSGIEFVLNSLGGSVSFEAGSDKPCLFRAYVNGTEWKNGISSYFEVSGETTITLKNVPVGELTIRLVKVTGHTLARAQLYSMTYYGTLSETAPADKELYIEFIGDSISCGWGVVGAHDGTYAAQDGTYAYPYLLSNRLNADYAVTALSGQGVLFHGTGMPNMLNGYLLASPLRNSAALYGFERKADIVVVNIGTNDYSHRGSNGITAESFADAYKEMLETIREKNGADCRIVCLYNTMNDTFADGIVAACHELGGMSAGFYTYEMDRAASGHPTIEENADYTDALEEFLGNVMDGSLVPPALKAESSGDGMSADVSQFQPMPNKR